MSRTYSLKELGSIVSKTAPILYLHDEEKYLPSSVDWFLEQATVVSKTGERTVLASNDGLAEDRLPVWEGQWPCPNKVSDYWLEVPDSTLYGNLATARSYVSIRRAKEGYLDITHWFWYPCNGAGTARLRMLAFDISVYTKEAIYLDTLGYHISDWEHITIRVTDDIENKVTDIYLSQHAGGHWLKPEQFEYAPSGQLIVYSSKNGHATYSQAGENYTAHIKTAPSGILAKFVPSAIEFWLRNDSMKGSRSLDCKENHEIVSIDSTISLSAENTTQVDAPPYFGRTLNNKGLLDEPRWLQYPYRWGPETKQKITHELIFKTLTVLIGPLLIYSSISLGASYALLGIIAALLLPLFIELENEKGKPGPKSKYTRPNFADIDSGPEPENLYEDKALLPLSDWVEGAAVDVAEWTKNAGKDAVDWTKNAGGDAVDWTKNAGEDAVDWTKNAGDDTYDWTKNAGKDAVDWTKNAGGDAANWTKNAGKDAVDWSKKAGIDTANWFKKMIPC